MRRSISKAWHQLLQAMSYVHPLPPGQEPVSCVVCGHKEPGDNADQLDWFVVATGFLPSCINCA